MKKLISIGLLLVANHVLAQTAATVLFTAKNVVSNHNGSTRAITRGAALDTGDSVITSAGSLANLKYLNGTLVNLGANSNYKILAYAPDKTVQINAELDSGAIEIKTPSAIHETLKTPVVSLAILGTDVRVFVSTSKKIHIQVVEGLVVARNEFLRPGSSVVVTPGHISNAPFPKEGLVSSPHNAPGAINSSSSSTTSTSSTSSSTSGTTGSSTASTDTTYGSVYSSTATSSTGGSSSVISASQTMAMISLGCNM